MVEEPALGLNRLRIALDRLPVKIPAFARALPGPLLLPLFANIVPEMIVPYADAAALMLASLDRGDRMARHRVELALPVGMRGRFDPGSAQVGRPDRAVVVGKRKRAGPDRRGAHAEGGHSRTPAVPFLLTFCRKQPFYLL